jgi:pimeloyl-ACP methyl ester carboxylesterase
VTGPAGEHPITVDWSGLTLAGSLHVPPGRAPSPAVLLLQGSGPSDRDSNGYFVAIRHALVDRGLATLCLDKPGCGSSTGDWRDHGLGARVDQARAALEVLGRHPAVDPTRVGLLGHSQGGWLVQRLAAELGGLCFAVASSGPSITVAEQDRFALEQRMRADDRPEGEVAEALAYLQAIHAAAVAGHPYDTVRAEVLDQARGRPWYRYHPIDDEGDWHLTCLLIGEPYDPLDALGQIRCPFLAVYGGADVLVPAWRSAEESGRALARSGNPDATVVVIPGADHRLQAPGSERLVPGYLDLLTDWMARRADRKARRADRKARWARADQAS